MRTSVLSSDPTDQPKKYRLPAIVEKHGGISPHALQNWAGVSLLKGPSDQHEEALLGATLLAILDYYHLPWENASFHLVILLWHLWGGIFQMSALKVEKSRYSLNMEGFLLSDNCRS